MGDTPQLLVSSYFDDVFCLLIFFNINLISHYRTELPLASTGFCLFVWETHSAKYYKNIITASKRGNMYELSVEPLPVGGTKSAILSAKHSVHFIYYRLVVHITDAITQHKNTKMVSHSALQNRYLHTTNTDRTKTLQPRPTVASFTHHNAEIQQCERSEGILTAKL